MSAVRVSHRSRHALHVHRTGLWLGPCAATSGTHAAAGVHLAEWLPLADIEWRRSIMPKGMQRGNREAKKPKKDHSTPKAPVTGSGAVVRPPAPLVADRHKKK
jgi:hypothetical protein